MPTTPERWLAEFQANTQDAGPSGDDQGDPVVIQLTTGNIVVLWEDESDALPAGANGTDIVGQIYDPLGNAVGAEFRANAFNIHDERNFDAAALDDGRFVVVYEDDEGGGADDVVIRATEWSTDANGVIAVGVDGPVSLTIATTPVANDTVRMPSVDAFADGSYVVAYEEFDDSASNYRLLSAIVSNAGLVGTPVVMLSGAPSPTTETDVAVLSNGAYVAVYDFEGVGGDDAIAFRIRDAAGGSATGATFVADTNTNGDFDRDASVVALAGGGFVISWTSTEPGVDTDIEFQRYDNAGVAQGTVQLVDGGNVTDANNESHLIALADGGFVVTYDDDQFDNDIALQRFSATGVQIGATVNVTNDTDLNFAPGGIGLADGRFVVGWTTESGFNENIDVAFFDTRDDPNAGGAYFPDSWTVGTIGDDVFTPALGFTQVVHGWDGDDVITENGDGSYRGGRGNDLIFVNSFILADSWIGGPGNDTIDWSASTATGGVFDLDLGIATDGIDSESMTFFENLVGTQNADEILGTGGGNRLVGLAGNDEISGRGGNDTILGGNGFDTLRGQNGDDVVRGGAGNDLIFGGAGNDRLFGEANNDTLLGWVGNDSLEGLNGDDSLLGEAGADTLRGGNGDDTARGGEGNDLIFGGAGNDRLFGEANNDTLFGFDGSDSLEGLNGDDSLLGEAGADTLRGGNGDDTARGGEGNDLIFGGAGNDRLFGEANNDTLFGFDGSDSLEGLNGDDSLLGEAGADTLRGGNGNDTARGGEGNDLIFGGNQNDTLFGGNQNDTLLGGDGNDSLAGNAGNDILEGGLGADILFGGFGEDNFRFTAAAQSSFFAPDIVQGFDGAGLAAGDRIGLAQIDADTSDAADQAFTFFGELTIAQGQAQGPGALWAQNGGGNETLVYANVDADGGIEFALRILDGGVLASDYTANDFFL